MLHFGYEVWIRDNRKKSLPEYDIQLKGKDGKTVVCYIPSESGEVSFSVTHPYGNAYTWSRGKN